MIIFKDFTFEAAHKLPLVPKNHKCYKLHGHSFHVRISIEGALNNMGWVMDFGDVKLICHPVINQLDHSYLNEIKGLSNPTSENIAMWIWDAVRSKLPNITSVEVRETCNSGCIYSG